MRLLQITNSLMSGGAEKLIIDTAVLFSKKNIQVDILLMDGTKTPFLENLKTYKTIKVFSLGLKKNIYNPFNIFKTIKYLKKYNIIHVHLFPALYWVAFAKIISFSNCKLILTEHNSTNRRRSNLILTFFDKIAYKQYDKIITISDAVDNNLRDHLGEKFMNFHKINNGINLEKFTNAIPYKKQELNFKKSDKLLIQVSSFTPQKDQKTLIRLMKKLPNSFKLLLVGEGPLLNESKELTEQLDISNSVHFLGLRSDVPRLLKTADFIFLSSNYEGLSLSSVEGMASGRPFLASDAPGLSEVVQDYGILFPIGDVENIKKHVLELTNDNIKYQKISKRCQKRSKDFDIDIMIDEHIKLYNSIL